MEGSGNVRNDLEMCQSGRSEGLTMVVVDKSSKLFLFDGSKQFVDSNEQVRGNGVTIK